MYLGRMYLPIYLTLAYVVQFDYIKHTLVKAITKIKAILVLHLLGSIILLVYAVWRCKPM